MASAPSVLRRDVIVVGASAGGVAALGGLARELPPDLPAAVLVVLHVSSTGTSVLPAILARAGSLPAEHARDGAALEPGHIYVAPPDAHLLVHEGRMRVTRGPKENNHRPAIDPLFRTAARTYGPRVVGVVLSGVLDDGTAGLRAIKLRGGTTVVQDPDDARYPAMPRSALDRVGADHVVPVAKMGSALTALAAQPVTGNGGPKVEERQPPDDAAALGEATGLTCPECGGAIWHGVEDGIERFRCMVGHRFSAASMLGAQNSALESALWSGIRALEERAALARRISSSAGKRSSAGLDEKAEDAEAQAALIRRILVELGPIAHADLTDEELAATEGSPR